MIQKIFLKSFLIKMMKKKGILYKGKKSYFLQMIWITITADVSYVSGNL